MAHHFNFTAQNSAKFNFENVLYWRIEQLQNYLDFICSHIFRICSEYANFNSESWWWCKFLSILSLMIFDFLVRQRSSNIQFLLNCKCYFRCYFPYNQRSLSQKPTSQPRRFQLSNKCLLMHSFLMFPAFCLNDVKRE